MNDGQRGGSRHRIDEARLVVRGLRDVIASSPGAFLGLAFCQALQGITPAGLIAVTAAVASGFFASLWVLLPAVTVLLLLADAVETYSLMLVTQIREKTDIVFRERMLRSSALWPDLEIFERPDLVNLRLEARQAIERSGRVVLILTNLMGGLLGLVPLVILAWQVSPWLAILVLIGLVPVTLSSLRLEDRVWSAEKDHLAAISKAHNLEEIGVNDIYAKDVRSLRMGRWLVRRWREERMSVFRAIAGMRTRGAVQITLLSLLSVAFSVAGLVLAIGGQWKAGGVVIALGVLLQMRGQMYAFVGNIAQLGVIWSPLISLERYSALTQGFDAVPPIKSAEHTSHPSQSSTQIGVQMRDVTFTYPGGDKPALAAVNLEIPAGSTFAIVGPNGAGKSTLLKLLSRLYTPDTGSIRVDGDSPAVMHQDFSRFPLTLRDNLSAGEDIPTQELTQALDAVGLKNWFATLPAGLETRLYKEGPDEGTLLSGGQWQRLALARIAARARSSQLVLFDEPTSSLDPEAEDSVMKTLLRHLGPKTIVWITHRMNHAASCDAMAVVEGGRVSAAGPAADVIKQNPWFQAAYESQRKGFALP